MEYTVQKLSSLAGVSARTLRYYDEIGILKPARINSSGYRIYGENEVNRLQLILFYRELDVPLETIKDIISSPSFDSSQALIEHHKRLLEKRERLDLLINNLEQTLSSLKGEMEMSNKEKFNGFKKKAIEDNEKKYGQEIRNKYGDKTVDSSNKKFGNMTEEQFERFTALGNEINEKLAEAMKTGNPSSNLSQEVAKLHKEWLGYTWTFYSKEAHSGLAQTYVADERFTEYYDENVGVCAAKFLRDSIYVFTGVTLD